MGCLAELNWKISYGPGDDRLGEFYIPALAHSVQYERTAGFFSSWSLAMAAAGIAHLIRVGGRMRLLVGAELSEEDVQAIELGEEAFGKVLESRLLDALEQLAADPRDPMRRRLEVLAWMVASGRLEIRVVLPMGADGRPLPAPLAQDYFHAKEGIFTDACGHQVAFSGSINETPHGWLHNYEQFSVYFSWDSTRPYLAQVVERTRRLWEGREEDWRAVPIPEAVRKRLILLAPDTPPEFDPLEKMGGGPVPPIPADQRERILFAFLRDAPHLEGGEALGVRMAGVHPWPHQARVVDEIVRRFPERFLLADEVGLGKTIEVGLALRALALSGAVRRCLILVPKSVLRQWQEELYEKFSLNVPVFDGHGFFDYFGKVAATSGNPWNAFPIVLASSQLAKRRERIMQILEAEPWDLVVVDEAHHARRKDILARNFYRPNRLLALIEGERDHPGLVQRTRGLLLLSATPMQLHPVELYDLLRQLDLPPLWAASEDRFLRFLEELRGARGGQVDWRLLVRLARASAEGKGPDQLASGASSKLGPLRWARVRNVFVGNGSIDEILKLGGEERAALLEICRRASPLGRRMFRSTRETLRRYREMRLLAENVPKRRPEPVWIPMTDPEWMLYQQVEDYVSDYYQLFEGERKGLGFIMTVYRRRLTSSFAALRRSLERRRTFLLERRGPLFGLEDEDLEDADLDQDTGEDLEEVFSDGRMPSGLLRLIEQELSQIEIMLEQLSRLPEDTKFRYLVDELSALLAKRNTAAVFTHYTDTMDDIRERLVGLYGRSLACYSGRGGERWDGNQWVKVSKEEVKNAFRSGEVRVLLCTEAASEGLNLQTCGVLINYDMPWNPMRVEQRIGRFDRIGQVYPDVWVHHYFLVGPNNEETVEANVYKALADRIDWFRSVVGELSPILARIERTIQRAAITSRESREAVLNDALADIRKEIEAQAALPSIDDWAEAVAPGTGSNPPLDLKDLERLLRQSSLGIRFQPHPEVSGALHFDWSGKLWEVTFDPAVADAHPGRVRLLTYGEPLLNEIIRAISEPVHSDEGTGLIRATAGEVRRWFVVRDRGLEQVRNVAELQKHLDNPVSQITSDHMAEATRLAAQMAHAALERKRTVEKSRAYAVKETLKESAKALVAEATACLMQLQGLEPREALEAVAQTGYPWAGLIKLSGYPDFREIEEAQGRLAPDEVEQRLNHVQSSAKDLLAQLTQHRKEELNREMEVTASAKVYLLPASFSG